MKKKILFSGLFLILFITQVFSQNIDLQGVFNGKYKIDNLKNLNFRPGTSQYTYVQNDTIFCIDASNGKLKEMITLPKINHKINGTPFEKIPFYEWINKDVIFFPGYNEMISITFAEILEGVPMFDNVIDQSIKNKIFIVKDDNAVYVKSAKNGYNPILLCPDTGYQIIFGETVHRSEWGIGEGQYFSPQANYIAFYRMDQSMVEDYPIMDVAGQVTSIETIKYPMAGKTSHVVKVGIFDVAASLLAEKPIFHYLNTDINDGEFLTNITFSPDEKYIYITHVNRQQNQMCLVEYDLKSGEKIKIVIEERDSKYVEPKTRPYFLKNSPFFIWQSDRDGWNHLYLYNRSGRLVTQLTQGEWEVTELYGVNPKEDIIYFGSTNPSPIGNYVYSLHVKTKKMKLLTPEEGTHNPRFTEDKKFFIDYFSNLETPNRIYLRNSLDLKSSILLDADNPYQSVRLGKTKIFTIKNRTNTDLFCRMIYPPDFDETQKYPVFIYVYGGPHSQLVTNTFLSGGIFLQYMAEKGFIVFSLDNRGTSKRGSVFEKSIHRQLGKLEMEDQMSGVNYLRSLPYVDQKNISLDGWSYGGFMVMSLITTYPDLFSTASCGGPVIDWSWYEVMYGERYMDTPEENPEGYKSSEILPKVKNIKSNLLVFHGVQDDTVLWQHSLKLLNQAVKDGIMMNYFVYPNHPHNVRGKDRIHLWKMIEKHHVTNLK